MIGDVTKEFLLCLWHRDFQSFMGAKLGDDRLTMMVSRHYMVHLHSRTDCSSEGNLVTTIHWLSINGDMEDLAPICPATH